MTSDAILYLATPSHDGKFEGGYVSSLVTTLMRFHGRTIWHQSQGSVLHRLRDVVLTRFLATSVATHLLAVDSDIAWTPDDIDKLLATGKEMVSGVYAQKTAERKVPCALVDGETWSWERLMRVKHAPYGFLLVSRAAAQRMVDAYQPLHYRLQSGEETCGMHTPIFDGDPWGEDVSFCRRWREIGGEIWMHPGVVVKHMGRTDYLPNRG